MATECKCTKEHAVQVAELQLRGERLSVDFGLSRGNA